jgi:hypothetical protein
VNASALATSLDRFLDECPWPAARLRRPFPWGRLRWIAGPRETLQRPPVHRRTATTAEALHRVLEEDLNASIDPRAEPPVRFTVIDTEDDPTPAGSTVAMTWFHPLMDPRGGQNLLVQLAGAGAGGSAPSSVAAAARRPFRERARLARRSLEYMRTLAPIPPVSPGHRLERPGPVRFRRSSFVDSGGRGRGARARREISWRLAVVGRAMAALWARRGLPDVPFLLPISVDMRPAGVPGTTFGNMLAFHFARFAPSACADVPRLANALRRQMAEAVRDGQIEANAAAMEFLQYRPLASVMRALPWTSSGEIFSFNCADVAEFPPALDQFVGRRVLNAYHVPCVLPRPGIGVFFNRCGERHNVVVSWVEGAGTAEDAASIIEVIRQEMAWIPVP